MSRFHLLSSLSLTKKATIILASLLLLAGFLRLYNIRDTIIFLGDEGRDALAVKHIIVDFQPTLLGPTASVGGFYLGPAYYYMIAPFIFVFGMDPVGAAVMVALMGTATVGLLFFIINRWYGLFPAAISSLLYATAPGVISFSRSSWNPNPIPLFTIAIIICLYYSITQKKLIWGFLAAACYGLISLNLHLLGLIMGIFLAAALLLHPKSHLPKLIPTQILGFLAGSSMFWAFELRHGFLNTQNIIEFITRSGGAAGPKSWNFIWLFLEVNRFNLEAVLGSGSALLSTYLSPLLIASVFFITFYKLLQKSGKTLPVSSQLILVYWLACSLGLALYRGQWHFHYFQFFFLAPPLLLAFSLSTINSKLLKGLILTLTFIFSVFLLTRAPTWHQGSRLLDQTERIADKVIELSDGQPYNFALITDGNSDHAYRFFLETNHAAPTLLQQETTKQLIIVCEKQPEDTCAPLGNPLWEIAGFGRAEIDTQTTVHPNITLYRLIHHPDSQDQIGQPAPKG